MKYIIKFNEKILEDKISEYLPELKDICDDLEVDYNIYIRILQNGFWFNIYERGEWTIKDNKFLFSSFDLDYNQLSRSYIECDIIINWNSGVIWSFMNRLKSYLDINFIKAYPNKISNINNIYEDERSYMIGRNESLIINGYDIKVNSTRGKCWISFKIN